ncbi:MAG: NAD(P)H-dependent oxidoreductase [Burkholderiales bacterium]|nr:NAD(P)H-dependent oxidoreductase [Burkholderiales bacterium]
MSKKNILILDCGTKNFGVGGKINHRLSDLAMKVLTKLGHSVQITFVDSAWEIPEEVDKIKKADVIIVQTPGWWMSPPWTFKKYEDQVFVQPGICGTDGRHEETPEDGYGTGGILKDKKYMLSSTWNAPKTAFDRKGDFFEGQGIDGVFLPVHKAFQFLGMKPMPSFMCNDVIKNPDPKKDDKRWEEHLKKYFS